MKESYGNDNLAIAWHGPGIVREAPTNEWHIYRSPGA